MRYMVIERFLGGDPRPVYRRFRDRGRLMPEGLQYVSSWVAEDFSQCFQVMECEDPRLLQEWMDQWKDLMEFEAIRVMTSAEAVAAVTPKL
jgi:hypothetical protein